MEDLEAQESSTARVTREVLDREEIWLPIPGHEGYEASNTMKIRSVGRWIEYTNRWGSVTRTYREGRELTQSHNDKDEYLRIALGRGAGSQKCVHRFICMAFHGPPPFPNAHARHLNDHKLDNRPENLAWGTRSDNALDSRRNKTWNNQNSVKDTCEKGHEYKYRADGHRVCLDCKREYSKEYRKRNIDKVREYDAKWKRKNRREKRESGK